MIELYYGLCVSTGQLQMHALAEGIRQELLAAKGETDWREFLDVMAGDMAALQLRKQRAQAGETIPMGDPDDPKWLKFQELNACH